MAYDFPVARSSATAAAPCQTAWALKAQWSCQLHTNHQRPASLQFGGAMAFKSHRHPAVPICYNDNVTYNHTPLKWPTIATKQYNMEGSNGIAFKNHQEKQLQLCKS
jgi:hypothetical protein